MQHVQHEVNNRQEEIKNNNKRAEILKEEKKYRIEIRKIKKAYNVIINESTVVVQKGRKNRNKLSWKNLFINQTNLLGADLLQ